MGRFICSLLAFSRVEYPHVLGVIPYVWTKVVRLRALKLDAMGWLFQPWVNDSHNGSKVVN